MPLSAPNKHTDFSLVICRAQVQRLEHLLGAAAQGKEQLVAARDALERSLSSATIEHWSSTSPTIMPRMRMVPINTSSADRITPASSRHSDFNIVQFLMLAEQS